MRIPDYNLASGSQQNSRLPSSIIHSHEQALNIPDEWQQLGIAAVLICGLIKRENRISLIMGFRIENHLLDGAIHCPSPNWSERESGDIVDLLVIHNISLPPGEFETGCIAQFFCNELDTNAHPYFAEIGSLKVSSHLLISRLGAVTQFVPFDKKAWHAGESSFNGRSNCNDFSIGIELEGTDYEEFTNLQYEVLCTVSKLLMQEYPNLVFEKIVGHSDIAPGRKTDPGPFFDWGKYRESLN